MRTTHELTDKFPGTIYDVANEPQRRRFLLLRAIFARCNRNRSPPNCEAILRDTIIAEAEELPRTKFCLYNLLLAKPLAQGGLCFSRYNIDMKSWKVPPDIQRHTWTVIEYPDYNVVVPSTDIAPHSVEGYTCPCKAQVEVVNDTHMVVHNSWQDEAAIASSLSKLF